jgi:glucan endo-1,3-alpha-glucosidase
MPQRMAQVLRLQPDFVEVLTWNDAGECHYVGDFWQEQIAGTTEGDYSDDFDHKGWLQVLTPFIKAFKAGVRDISQISPPGSAPVGTFWYRTLLTSASCSSSIQNYQQGQDAINFAIILPSTGYTIKVFSSNQLIGSFPGQPGLNYNSVLGLQAGGGQFVQVIDALNKVIASATGTKNVLTQSPNATCNWNYEVVGFS